MSSSGTRASNGLPRVLFAEYPLNRWNLGGKERRTRALAAELERLGARVGYYDAWSEPDRDFDILQIFGSEYYQAELVKRARSVGLAVATFSILVFRSSADRERTRRWRHLDRFCPVTTTFGLRRSVLADSDLVFFASEAERRDAQDVYGVTPRTSTVVRSTVSPEFADASPIAFERATGLRDFVLAVGRIEPRKNTLRLIEAARRCALPLVLIGPMDQSHPDFSADVRARVDAHPDLHWLPPYAPDDPLLASAYAAARVHVLPSFHETAGLVNMEALLTRTQVVTTPLDAVREYMRDYAFYANPEDVGELAAKIREAYDTPFDERARDHVLETLTHPSAARAMLDAYRGLLASRS